MPFSWKSINIEILVDTAEFINLQIYRMIIIYRVMITSSSIKLKSILNSLTTLKFIVDAINIFYKKINKKIIFIFIFINIYQQQQFFLTK
jgi:hypothetical protein